jgi:G3E family GTPase
MIPLHMLTGFLGSGKTTLLNRILRDPAWADSAVLINEIGAVSIDHHLVDRIESGDELDVVVLKGGCTCCALRGDLVAGLRELYRRRAEGLVPPFGRVVLETTGLADPAPVLFTLAADPALRHKFARGVVVATFDAMHGLAQLARHPEARKQIAVADRIVLTKTDLEGADTRALCAAVRRINPAAAVLDTQDAATPAGLLEPGVALSTGFHAEALPDHSEDIASVAILLDRPLAWAPFSVWLSLLLHAHGEKMLRHKALLDVAGWTGPVALDAIHHLVYPPRHLDSWPAGPRRSRLVFIAQGLRVERIEPSLRAFLAGEYAWQELSAVQ